MCFYNVEKQIISNMRSQMTRVVLKLDLPFASLVYLRLCKYLLISSTNFAFAQISQSLPILKLNLQFKTVALIIQILTTHFQSKKTLCLGHAEIFQSYNVTT